MPLILLRFSGFFLGGLIKALKAGSFGNIPKEECSAPENHDNRDGEKEEDKILHQR